MCRSAGANQMTKAAFLATSVLLVIAESSAVSLYELTDLGDLPGGYSSSAAYGINDVGQVVGIGSAATGARAFLWADGTMVALEGVPGGGFSLAFDINNVGQVAGYIRVDGKSRAFLWDDGEMIDLPLLPDTYESVAYSINDAGHVVGYSRGATSGDAFYWDGAQMMALPGSPWHSGQAFGINNSNQVVGYAGTPTGTTRSFLWSSGTAIDLGSLTGGDDRTNATAISDAGQVAGFGDTGSAEHAFLWKDGEMTILGDLPGGNNNSRGLAVNSAGQVVGYGFDEAGQKGFLWQSGSLYDLNDLIHPNDPLKSEVTITHANAINEHGWIAATGDDRSTGVSHGYLLVPVGSPEELFSKLVNDVIDVGPGRSLFDKVTLAQTYYAVPDVQATCAVLTDFGNEVRAQRGKKIPAEVADDLAADAEAIMEAIGCE